MNTHAETTRTPYVMKPVFRYILDSIDGDGYGVNLVTDKQKIDFVYNTFRSEYSYQIEYYNHNLKRAFSEYLAGLPSCINIEFRNFYILEMSKNWGRLAEDATEEQEDQILKYWFDYIASNFFELREKLSVNNYLPIYS